MPTRNALASARLQYSQPAPGAPYHINLQVWSHSYDHPNAVHRSALVNAVYLTQLPLGPAYAVSNIVIKDRYGIDQTALWRRSNGIQEEGFEGYTELDTHGACGPGLTNVLWSANSGIYDERCAADPSCDAKRLQTYLSLPEQLTAYNYLLGPVTFSFDIVLSAPPSAVRLQVGHIGGNGGHPAQRAATIPQEQLVIQFP
jgi:hypothetical protein